MAQKTRQARLFAAEDFTVVYDSFINANLQAYDYDTIRTAMVEYVRNTYPENYNDWIESAEFVALLDVVAQFGHNLAFRVDLNSRNNFLSTAERQDSVFKLAEFLGYTPKRNVPAFGEMKIVSVKTNETVIGSNGTNIGGEEIRYDATSNINNLDDFVTVMNAVLQQSNTFGNPVKQAIINNISHQFYKLNNTEDQIKFSVTGTAAGKSTSFDIVGLDLESSVRVIKEHTPNRDNSFSIVYKNDGKGVSSDNTGFFVGVKQGSLQFKDFTIDQSIDNMKFDIDVNNVNNTDVWVSSIDAQGNTVANWTKVDSIYGQNEIYNSLPNDERNIFSVKTRENNQITICFSDRNFGNLPKGRIRVWYRTSENNSYTLRPDDIGSKKITINYTGLDGNSYIAVFGIQLKTPVTSASSSESLNSIKENAPRVYSAQNRMITASDYNNVIKTHSENALKIKSINRTHSGHSRYFNTQDPTGAYTSLNVYNKDGKLFSYNNLSSVITSNETASNIYNKYVKNILNNSEIANLYYTKYISAFESLKPSGYPNFTGTTWPNVSESYQWQSPTTTNQNNGYFIQVGDSRIARLGRTQVSYVKNVEVGALLEFVVPKYDSNNQVESWTSKWAKVVNIYNAGLGAFDSAGEPTGLTSSGTGSVILDADIPDNAYLKTIVPALNRVFSDREKDIIIGYLNAKRNFAVHYNVNTTAWEVFTPGPSSSYTDQQPLTFNDGGNEEQSWLLWFEYTNSNFEIYVRTTRFEFNSDAIEFSNITNEYNLSTYTNKPNKDVISVLSDNFEVAGKFFITGYRTDTNGVSDTHRVIVSLEDSNSDNRPDNPNAYNHVVGGEFILFDLDNSGTIRTVSGKDNIRFEWEHNPDDGILVDPSFTNVIDVFVLDNQYDNKYKAYLQGKTQKPIPPTSYQLSKAFSGVENKKAMSDSIVYRSVSYKSLFGKTADPSLKAKFRVIKLKGSSVTDNDVKTKIIEKVNEYFDVNNWEFGETFYFTELAAYVHQELSGIISSFVIVPQGADSVFGDLFEIKPASDEMFIPDVTISDIDIIDTITDANIRSGQQ